MWISKKEYQMLSKAFVQNDDLRTENERLHEKLDASELTFAIQVSKMCAYGYSKINETEYLKSEAIKQLVDKIANTEGFLKETEHDNWIEYQITVKKVK